MLTVLDGPRGTITLAKSRVLQLSVELTPERVRTLTAERGMSLTELAERLEVVPSAVTNWLGGSRSISIDRAVEIAVALQVDLEEICRVHLRIQGARQHARLAPLRVAR